MLFLLGLSSGQQMSTNMSLGWAEMNSDRSESSPHVGIIGYFSMLNGNENSHMESLNYA